MSPSMGFPGSNQRKIKVPADPENWLDKAVVVSIFPIDIDEKKPTIQPGRFIMPAGSLEKPSVLVVGRSTWWRTADEDQDFEVANGAIQVANSIVNDYIMGAPEASHHEGIGPGLFWIPGAKYDKYNKVSFEYTYKWVVEENTELIAKADAGQKEWYLRLVNMADALWAMSKGNPLAISSTMKMAARAIGQDDKEWLKNYKEAEKKACFACGMRNNPEAIICMNCRFVLDAKRFEMIKNQFASPTFNPESIKR